MIRPAMAGVENVLVKARKQVTDALRRWSW